MHMRMERRVLTPMHSVDDLVYVLNSYTLAEEWGTGGHLLVCLGHTQTSH